MKRTLSTLFIAIAFIFIANNVKAQCGSNTKTSKVKTTHNKSECKDVHTKIVAIKFHADYCGACKNLEPKITQLKKDFTDKEVIFVRFDFTNSESKENTKHLAETKGLNVVLNSYSGTGFVILYDLEKKKVVGKLTNAQNIAEMKKEIKTYL